MRSLLTLLFLAASTLRLAAQAPVYVVLWFDTEDYVLPASDDAALRIARDLDQLGVKATFKVVGEKARVLESRGRRDVIRALSGHDIGYHSNYHSIPPAPSVYLRTMGFLEGADEFQRREESGAADVRRIFGLAPSCYGQPGSSWAPQTNLALRRMGIPMYLDEGSQVHLNDQPFWYGGLLYVFAMGRFNPRANLNDESKLPDAIAAFDKAAAELRDSGGGVISIYYHPTEFVTTEFWDAVNFSRGAFRERAEWVRPQQRTAAESERAFSILHRYVEHAKGVPGVRFITARKLLPLFGNPAAAKGNRAAVAQHLAEHIGFLDDLSAADQLLLLLGAEPGYVDGPLAWGETTWTTGSIPRTIFDRAKQDAVASITRSHRLPSVLWLGSQTLSLADFAATLASDDGRAAQVAVRKAHLEFDPYFAADPQKSFNWVIHPEGFRAPELLEMARLQGWTLKPARLH
jgi:hypothetical protein